MPVSDPNSENLYTVLGVERGATDTEISKAYKRAAVKWHPDKNPDDKEKATEMFQKVSEAYEILSDADKRKTYDQFGKQGLERGAGGGQGGMSFAHADDIFQAFFGGGDPFSMFFDGQDGGDGFGGMPGGFGKGGPRIVFQSGGGMPGMMGGPMGGKGKGKGKPKPAEPIPDWAKPKGTRVIVRGLKSAAEHNGRQGKITGWTADKGRYEVECDDETTLSLRPGNVTQVADVEITGIESTPELNGQQASVIGYTDDTGRYTLRLKSKMSNGRDVVGLQSSSIILGRGTRVVVSGLSSEAFNGQMAQIVDVDRDAMRYTVQCQNGKQIKIKLENVLC